MNWGHKLTSFATTINKKMMEFFEFSTEFEIFPGWHAP
jgi:hypothetical protein